MLSYKIDIIIIVITLFIINQSTANIFCSGLMLGDHIVMTIAMYIFSASTFCQLTINKQKYEQSDWSIGSSYCHIF